MERGEDGGVLRSRCRSPETPPTSPDRSFSSLDGDRKPEQQQQQGNGVSHATSNGIIEVEHVISKKLQLQRKAEDLNTSNA
ncbi:hypothetical protein JOQ06_005266 [Pogonophryne albipinna]|uniref:Uncharacterized protein n=1 Tax=Pogonophryne albipinna TaxID=1090488 RepID=A0AAD6BFP9_9TELE|nr:hypothetical protein JOQ06_005266 [Pogonophryne albipinna]